MKNFIIILMLMSLSSCKAQKPEMKMNAIDHELIKQIEKHKTPALHYIIFNKDSILYRFKKGFSDVKNEKPIDENTKFNAFSITKTFTALAILQLEEQGKLGIDKPVKDYLPDFRYSSDITIKQLLTHSAGIPNPVPLSWIHSAEEHSIFDSRTFFNQVFEKHNKSRSKPNERFAYSNLGYVILGQLIEKISGQKYEDYIVMNVLTPLNISQDNLGFEILNTKEYARGYHKKSGISNLVLGLFINKSKFMGKPEGKWKPFRYYYVNGASYGGLIGTPDALVAYLREFLQPEGELISGLSKEKLFTENITVSGKHTGMCMAWFKGRLGNEDYYTHAGGGGGFYCEIRLYPGKNIGSVIMFNRSGMKDERFLDRLDKHIIENPTPD
ncbi:MAG: beta-lactamase family protein [Bacteroidales bacterium]|nr:beta-lactamase family protein [Bacteroidales bacterium]